MTQMICASVHFQPKSPSLINNPEMSVFSFLLVTALHEVMQYFDVLILTQPVCN